MIVGMVVALARGMDATQTGRIEMEIGEYQRMVDDENARHRKALRDIEWAFAKANNPYQIGDIVRDHHQTGKILGIGLFRSSFSNNPSCHYRCELLKANGTPRKKYEEITIYQSNVKPKLG
jgi:hypothetical protein